MVFADESATWTSAGALGVAALFLALGVFLFWRWRRAAAQEIVAVQESTARTERLVGEVHAALADAQEEGRRITLLGELGSTLDLDAALRRALEAVSELTGADAAMIVLHQEEGEPITAAFGLSEEESSRELIGVPPDPGGARAIRLSYLYTPEEALNDEFRLSGGLAVPLLGESEERIGTLAIFSRRVEQTLSESELEQFEELSRIFGPALENARLFAEARRLADTDQLTGLHNARYFHERLQREIARARRYNRRLGLLLFDVEQGEGPTSSPPASASARLCVRRTSRAISATGASRSSSPRLPRRTLRGCTAASSSRSAAASTRALTVSAFTLGSSSSASRTMGPRSGRGPRRRSSGRKRPPAIA